jgi:hypothetical protein
MKTTTINERVIDYLKSITDESTLKVEQNKHLRLTGVYAGKKRVFFLSCSPSSSYQCKLRSSLRRFLRTLDIETDLKPIF